MEKSLPGNLLDKCQRSRIVCSELCGFSKVGGEAYRNLSPPQFFILKGVGHD
jgi:hypothetical protein